MPSHTGGTLNPLNAGIKMQYTQQVKNTKLSQKIYVSKFPLPYLESAWNMQSLEYKQAHFWCSGSWDSHIDFDKVLSNFDFSVP